MYTLFILNGRKTCFWSQNKVLPGCRDEQFCGAWNSLWLIKNKYCHIDGSRRCNCSNNTLFNFIHGTWSLLNILMNFDIWEISIILTHTVGYCYTCYLWLLLCSWVTYILGYKYVAMLQLPFEALVHFSFSITPMLFCSQMIGDEFCSNFCCRLPIFIKIPSGFAFQIKEWFQFNMLQAHLAYL